MVVIRILPIAGERKPREPSDEDQIRPEPTPARLR